MSTSGVAFLVTTLQRSSREKFEVFPWKLAAGIWSLQKPVWSTMLVFWLCLEYNLTSFALCIKAEAGPLRSALTPPPPI